ncbi:MAG TPA: SCP2 sterol-binding domain-containing protein [Dehalococcoidia bacterium]|nr:SCP2 sterol-binding domain-containing protein [Dehalococcoidia bacterium]
MTEEHAIPGPEDFTDVMRRTIQLVGTNVPRSSLQKVAELLHTLSWEFKDYGVKIYFLVDDLGGVDCATEWSGHVDSSIIMNASTFHNAAYGKANFGAAMVMGKLHVKGISPLKLGKFNTLSQPFLSSYRQACGELYEPAV